MKYQSNYFCLFLFIYLNNILIIICLDHFIINNKTNHHHICDKDIELDQLVQTNGTRSIMYLLCHDDKSEHIANKFAYCKENWVKVIKLNASIFFETVIYKDIYPKYSKDWDNIDYIISATYKTIHTIQLHKGIYYRQDENEIKKMLKVTSNGNYDHTPFL